MTVVEDRNNLIRRARAEAQNVQRQQCKSRRFLFWRISRPHCWLSWEFRWNQTAPATAPC